MDPGDSAAWTAAVVGTVAAAASLGMLWVAIRQVKSAHAQADAAAQLATEACRHKAISEQQLTDKRQHEILRHIGNVHTVLRAADAVRNELCGNATAVIERHRLAFTSDEHAVLVLTADRLWEDAVNTVRIDQPPASAVTTAIRRYHGMVEAFGVAVSAADDLADQGRLDDRHINDLTSLVAGIDAAYGHLEQACAAFLAKHGVFPVSGC